MNAPVVTPAEMTIRLGKYGITEFQGTRAMLESEGIIPANMKWPEAYDNVHWDAGKFEYWMRRERPDGARGPRKLFVDVDWWCLRQQVIGESFFYFELKRKTRELAEYAYRNSARGIADSNMSYKFYAVACADEKFQAFKASIPGLAQPKRGRRSVNRQTEGAQ
jgi:hypothetical protein